MDREDRNLIGEKPAAVEFSDSRLHLSEQTNCLISFVQAR